MGACIAEIGIICFSLYGNGRSSVQFKLIPLNYEFPTSKPKHQTFEWNHPKGILKKNWMKKHLNILPPVVVFFRDIEWNDPQWTEKQYECASLMQLLKNSLQVISELVQVRCYHFLWS